MMESSSSDGGSDGPVAEGVKSERPATIAMQDPIKAEPCEEKPPSSVSLKLLLSPVGTKEEDGAQLSADQLKKHRRNERDRKRSFAKRETMDRMRKMVAALELQKQQLMENVTASSLWSHTSSISAEQCASPSFWPNLVVSASPTSLYPSSSTSVTRDDYVQLAAEIEEFRRQNSAMAQELARRDLFNNSLRYRLASFPPLDSRSGIQPTQLTQEEGMDCVWQTLERIHDARLRYASEACFQNRPTFLGWSQYSERQGDVVTFGVKKALRNVTPQQLMDRTWQLQTNDDNLRRLGPSHLHTHITLLQKVSDDILVIDRHTEDQSRTDGRGRPLKLRTVYVLFRVADNDGIQTLGIKTLDVPEADRMLRADEVWWDIFYWIRVSPAHLDAGQEVTTVTEFGGANSCACEELASSRLKELIFLATRWETLAVAPFLLQ